MSCDTLRIKKTGHKYLGLNTDQFLFAKLAFIGAAIGKYATKSSARTLRLFVFL
jgi:hypothetical protein